ncbi:MAG: F0F1 ATP synthase subunit delta [bacterium]|nr:F0F1 ATP synthase subunit delta [bacterium]
MKPSATLFAKAFLTVLAGTPETKQGAIVKNLVRAASKYGGDGYLRQISNEVLRLYRKERGFKKIVLYSARPLSKKLHSALIEPFNKSDEVQEKVNPELIAGVKIVIDEELSLDNTLKRKLEVLFK